MPLIVLESLDDVDEALGLVRPELDVIAFHEWRLTISTQIADGPVWIMGSGRLSLIERDAMCGARIRELVNNGVLPTISVPTVAAAQHPVAVRQNAGRGRRR